MHQPRGTLHRMHRGIDILPQQLTPQKRIVQKGLAFGRVVTLRSSVGGGGVVREGWGDGRRPTVGSCGGGVGSSSSGRTGGGGGRVENRRASHHGSSEARSGRQRQMTVRRAAIGIGRGGIPVTMVVPSAVPPVPCPGGQFEVEIAQCPAGNESIPRSVPLVTIHAEPVSAIIACGR